jgi:deoxycytidine triphosphate deaminase
MYLSDRELTALLPELDFHTEDAAAQFSPTEQVQPCSIDLRLDRVFWRPTGHSPLDLRRSRFLEAYPRNAWTKIILVDGEAITLNAGAMILSRTLEAFTMPGEYAGLISGRSSFARLGLAIHCTAELINPGWSGRAPLQIINLSRRTIRIVPMLPICQISVTPLSSRPKRLYGTGGLSSKYMDDDGGPSFWWRDKRVSKLHEALARQDLSLQMQDRVLEVVGFEDPEVLGRLEDFILSRPQGEITNADDLLDAFAASEGKAEFLKRLSRDILIGAAPLLIACSVGSLYSQPFGWTHYGWIHYVLWAVTILSAPVSLSVLRSDIGEYLTPAALDHRRRQRGTKTERRQTERSDSQT